MIQFQITEVAGTVGFKIIFFWIFHFSFLYNSHKGDHISLGFGLGCTEAALQLSVWRG